MADRLTLREARKKRGFTQERLSQASGIPQAVISKIERGRVRNPSFSIVCDLAAALRIDPRVLRFGASPAKPPQPEAAR